MTQFLYQDTFDPQVFIIPEFDSIGEYTLETVQEVLDTFDSDDYSLPIPEFISDYDVTIDAVFECLDSFEVDSLYDLIEIVIVPSSGYLLDLNDYYEDVLELFRSFDIFESGFDSESWTILNVLPEPIMPIQYNFGKPYSPGKWGVPGDYIFPYAYSTTPMTLVADTIYYVPLYIPYQMHIDQIGLWISTVDLTGEARLGIYGTQRGFITDLIYDNIIALNSTGFRSVGADVWLTEGLYFLAMITNSNTAQIYISALDDRFLAVPHPDYDNTYKHYVESRVYTSGLPTVAGTGVIKNDATPRIIVRLA